jgi:hypothetical protein
MISLVLQFFDEVLCICIYFFIFDSQAISCMQSAALKLRQRIAAHCSKKRRKIYGTFSAAGLPTDSRKIYGYRNYELR